MDENAVNQEKQSPQQPEQDDAKYTIKVVLAVFIGVVIIALFMANIGRSISGGYLTYENYMDINNGMTYSEVVKVLDGHEGELNTSAGSGGYSIKYYSWKNSSGSRIIVVGFMNGVVCAKSQVGLT